MTLPTYTECVACSGELNLVAYSAIGEAKGVFWNCKTCNGLHGDALEEEYCYKLVKPMDGSEKPLPDEQAHLRYFDLQFFDSKRNEHRRHGWYDVRNNRCVQVG